MALLSKIKSPYAKNGRIDAIFLLAVLLVTAYGTLMVFSAGVAYAEARYNDSMYFIKKQSIWLLIGFVVMVDDLMNAITRQKIDIPFKYKNTFVLYDKDREDEAIRIAKEFRSSGKQTELVLKQEQIDLDEYVSCAKRDLCVSMMYLKKNNEIEMINLLTGKSNCISKSIK